MTRWPRRSMFAFGVKRTWRGRYRMSAFDPKRAFADETVFDANASKHGHHSHARKAVTVAALVLCGILVSVSAFPVKSVSTAVDPKNVIVVDDPVARPPSIV